jgi:hypothetical protein
MNPRCEGWRRYGGAFSLGPAHWEQCELPAIVKLTVRQDGKTATMPACKKCWQECLDNKIKILKAEPLP